MVSNLHSVEIQYCLQLGQLVIEINSEKPSPLSSDTISSSATFPQWARSSETTVVRDEFVCSFACAEATILNHLAVGSGDFLRVHSRAAPSTTHLLVSCQAAGQLSHISFRRAALNALVTLSGGRKGILHLQFRSQPQRSTRSTHAPQLRWRTACGPQELARRKSDYWWTCSTTSTQQFQSSERHLAQNGGRWGGSPRSPRRDPNNGSDPGGGSGADDDRGDNGGSSADGRGGKDVFDDRGGSGFGFRDIQFAKSRRDRDDGAQEPTTRHTDPDSHSTLAGRSPAQLVAISLFIFMALDQEGLPT
ncbi:hypothetical protein E1B28_009881 [Marasmius oreades]|uniref:Uncharacterized protein n=1 Tax=Marasmius oreades TaxID=181124 RepID=A0A9P7UQK2_9AGAR|nr:uncharacterized protein E1B28_009881 [Marasmius oreades]KAG7090797.1 hypothetical protein E1B28_009881 [Marasmius oreades]